MRASWFAKGALFGCFLLLLPLAGTAQPSAADLEGVMRSLRGPAATELPMTAYSDEGYLRFISAPPGGYFAAPLDEAKSVAPEQIAEAFLETHRAAFGAGGPKVSLELERMLANNGRHFVRMGQSYGGVPIYGAEIVTAVGEQGGVYTVLGGLLYDTRALDTGAVSLVPAVSSEQAAAAAKQAVAAAHAGVPVGRLRVHEDAALQVYAPGVIHLAGPVRLAYAMVIRSSTFPPVTDQVLVDAHSGEVILRFTLLDSALNRRIFDANNTFNIPGLPTRDEGQAARGIKDVDEVYDFLGETYNFYFSRFGRDSYDNRGGRLTAIVRLPFLNAFWSPAQEVMGYGTGLGLLDIVAHEYTHGVTQFTSDLIYLGISGAINESMSDIFGEFVDQTSPFGNPDPAVRWIVGDGLSEEIVRLFDEDSDVGIRNMANPPERGHPDRVSSPYFVDPNNIFFDNGGVHINSGIPNKLAYLLTDGDFFNGQQVEGMGLETVARLFYGAQLLLPRGASFQDLYFALAAVGRQIGLTFEERLNILRGARAVEIAPETIPGVPLANGFRARPVTTLDGDPAIALTWARAAQFPLDRVILVRDTVRFPQAPGDGETLADGLPSAFLDTDVTAGQRYFYTAFFSFQQGAIAVANASAVAGEEMDLIFTEPFGVDPGIDNPFDLSFRQVTYHPIGAPQAPLGDNTVSTSYESYTVSVQPADRLPFRRGDNVRNVIELPLREDGFAGIRLEQRSFPFFGRRYDTFVIAANGYITFDESTLLLREEELFNPLNFPSLAAHFAAPRISYLFADLAPAIGGETWAKILEDRVVVTVENMPEWRFTEFVRPPGNTVQLEIFFSGKIRMTYLEVSVQQAVAGISDGRGVPVDPADIFDNVESIGVPLVKFREAPAAAPFLTLEPVAPLIGEGGDLFEFEIRAVNPPGVPFAPRLLASWDRPGAAPFEDLRNGVGRFGWESGINDSGFVTVRVRADLMGQTAFQDVRISLDALALKPEARDLQIATELPDDTPGINRTVPTETALFASYTYFHPQIDVNPRDFTEGSSILIWYRNNRVVPHFLNQPEVSRIFTNSNDFWHFEVVPITASGIAGEGVRSPVVTIAGGPEIIAVTPNSGLVTGGQTVRVTGRRLDGPSAVRFGGVRGANVRSLGPEMLEVTTPLRLAGTVDVEVTSAAGTTSLPNAFTFVSSADQMVNTDVNGDGRVDALDLQLVVNALLGKSANPLVGDVNGDGRVDALDVQLVVNDILDR